MENGLMPAMRWFVPLYIGLRYVYAKRRNAFISFVSLFAFLGMALGVFALIVVLSVMNGFDGELKTRILRVVPHATLSAPAGVKDWASLRETVLAQNDASQIMGMAPYLKAYSLITYTDGVRGIELQGIHPELEADVSVIDHHMLVGQTTDLVAGDYNIILGSLLARYLGVTIGDRVNVTLPMVSVTPAGVIPRSKRFTVTGVFEVGAQLDQVLALIHYEDAQKLLRKKGLVDGLRLRFDSIYLAGDRVEKVETRLNREDLMASDWSESQGSLFQAIKMEKTVVGVLLGIIIAVAAFNIVTSLIMMIAEKRSDIAVLRTVGLSARGVVAIFLVQGLIIGVVGILIGLVLGVLFALNLADIVASIEQAVGAQIFDPSVYFVTSMPSELQISDVIAVAIGAFAISFVATCYPAYKASQIAPAEALRYNV